MGKEAEPMDACVKLAGVCVLAAALAVVACAQEAPAPPETAAADVVASSAPEAAPPAPGDEALEFAGVRPFEPMTLVVFRPGGSCPPVYFRSPLAEPSGSDAAVDRCVPLAAGAAVADWMMFTVRVLAFPIEMVLAPPWQTRPLAPAGPASP